MRRARLAFPLLLVAAACRNGSKPEGLFVLPNASGVNGCSGPNQTFTLPQTPVPVPLATLVVSPSSQITSAGTGETLFSTGADGQVVAIDVSGPTPVELEIVPAGTGPGSIGELLATVPIAGPASLSGIAVLDENLLVVVEHTSNTLVSVLRIAPFTVAFLAGAPNTTPGFADGLATGKAALARFSFGAPTQVCPTGGTSPKLFVADSGNHAIRLVSGGAVITVAGEGLPAFQDGSLASAFFDTPTGISAACNGALVVSERGGNGFGNRIRQVGIGPPSPFGGFTGDASTLVGDGTDATTEDVGTAALVAEPVSPLVTSLGEIYWVDSGTGVLRRRSVDRTADCPLDIDCDAAVLNPSFPPGHAFSLTETPSGVLYVLDATAGVLYRVTP